MLRRAALPLLFAALLPAHAAAGPSLNAEVVDRRGVPVPCESAVLLETDAVTTCDAEGRFVLPWPEQVGEPLTLVVFASGFRDAWLVLPSPEAHKIVLRRGRTRRSQSTTRVGGWRELPRLEPAVDTDLIPGRTTVTPSSYAHAAGGYGDLNRALHAAPGVSGDTAASARFRIHGGEPGESLTFVDGIRVEDATHLGGLFGALDPDLMEEARIETGAGSAADPDALAGSLHVRMRQEPKDRFDGSVDLSFLGAAATLAVDLSPPEGDPDRGAAVVLGVRRSLLQAYLGAFKALGLVDIPLETVDFGSAFGRLTLRPGPGSQVTLSLLHLHDRALFDDVNLRHRMLGGALRWTAKAGPRTEVLTHLSWGGEEQAEPEVEFEYPGRRVWSTSVQRGRALVAVEQGFGGDHLLRVGLDGGLVFRREQGELFDPAELPAWATLPQADLRRETSQVALASDHGELAFYGETELRGLGPLSLLGGLRVAVLNASLTPTVSPRLAASLALPTGATLRASVALSHQERLDLFFPGSVVAPRPERALTVMLGLGQPLGPAGVLQVLGWGRALDHLWVPDGEAVRTDGTGLAGGVDVTWQWRLGRFEANANYSLLVARRSNPYADPKRVPPSGDQRHDVEVSGRVYLGRARNFLVGLGYSGASAPPTSTLSPIELAPDRYEWEIVGVNDRRLAPVHRLDLRLEHRIPTRVLRLRASFELNADLGGRVFLENCPATPGEDGSAPSCRPLTFWPPLRPWLGLKAEW